MKPNTIKLISAVLVLVLASLACGTSSTPVPPTSVPTVPPTSVPTEPPAPTVSNEEIDQWAVTAMASSEFGVSGWIATQATGAPDVGECGDNSAAWASMSTDTVEWLLLGYTTPVYATEVVIYITYNPDYVTALELVEPNGSTHTVYTGQPTPVDCPDEVTISFPKTTYLVSGVILTIDQTTLNDWSEIDAVQLTGTLR